MPTRTAPYFTADSLKFLRSLKRNNDRDWFTPRKPQFEALLRNPMLALIKDINAHMESIAPSHIRTPEKTILRIYRDTRFSANKLPYKSNVSAWWAHTQLPKTSGAGFYIHLSTEEFLIAAGVYMPQREQLLAIRRHLLEHHAELRRILNAKSFRTAMPGLDTQSLSRPPKGFPADHPGIDLIRQLQWGRYISLPPEAAFKPSLLKDVVSRFKLAAPMINLLNAPLANEESPRRRAVFALP